MEKQNFFCYTIIGIFILLSRESDQRAIRARLGVAEEVRSRLGERLK